MHYFLDNRASLPAILNLFLLWGVLFITYALLDVEVFSLTRWMVGESRVLTFPLLLDLTSRWAD